jgi:hypothetical protein
MEARKAEHRQLLETLQATLKGVKEAEAGAQSCLPARLLLQRQIQLQDGVVHSSNSALPSSGHVCLSLLSWPPWQRRFTQFVVASLFLHDVLQTQHAAELRSWCNSLTEE